MVRSAFFVASVTPVAFSVGLPEADLSCPSHKFVKENFLLQVERTGMSKGITDEGEETLPKLKPEWAMLAVNGSREDRVLGPVGLLEEELAILMRWDKPSNNELEHFNLVKNLRRRGWTCPDGTSFAPNQGEFEWDCRLWRAGRLWSQRMATEGFEGHRYAGSEPCDRTEAQGFPKNKGCGENLAMGRDSAQIALEQLQASNDHCKNMMDPAWNKMGVGYFANKQSKYAYYWTDPLGSYHRSPDQGCIGGSPAPTLPAGCDDTDSNCQYYKQVGYCSSNSNVKAACKDSCGIGNCAGSVPGPSPSPVPRPSPSPPSGGGSCVDTAGSCDHYQRNGYCATSANVKAGCKRTCGLCGSGGAGAGSCDNVDPNCQYYRDQGYCNTDNVKTQCRRSCGLC